MAATEHFSHEAPECLVLVARLTDAPGTAATAYPVRNLSSAGACIAASCGLAKGNRLIGAIGRVEVAAVVDWARGGFAGVAFVVPIDVARARNRRG